MSTRQLLLQAIDFKTLDFSRVTVVSGKTEITPTKPIIGFPAGAEVRLEDAKMSEDLTWTFDARVGSGDVVYKNVRSAPVRLETAIYHCLARMDVTSGPVSKNYFWKDGTLRHRHGIEIYLLLPLETHRKEVELLKKRNIVIDQIWLYLGGDRDPKSLTAKHLGEVLELYREHIDDSTIVVQGGYVDQDVCQQAANILGIKFDSSL